MPKITFLFFFLSANIVAQCQIKAYSLTSKNIEGSDETVQILIDPIARNTKGGNQISLVGVLANTLTAGINLIKISLSREEQKYTATYTSSLTGTNLMLKAPGSKNNSAILNIDSIHIIRSIIKSDLTSHKVTEIVLIPQFDYQTGLYRFRLSRLNMFGSKAKVKKLGHKGKLLDISIDIKLDAIWKEISSISKADTSHVAKANEKSTDTAFSYKTGTLGSSSILVTKISPVGVNIIRDDFYSGWFQPLPTEAFKIGDNKAWLEIGNYALSITVKEANPFAIEAKKLNDFLSGSSGDINTLIKQFLPNAGK